MTFTESVFAGATAFFGAYEAFLSMFVQRPSVVVWILSPLVWPVAWVLNGPLGRHRLAYLVLCTLVIGANAAVYAFAGYGVIRFLGRQLDHLRALHRPGR
jgi:hypothetical protein